MSQYTFKVISTCEGGCHHTVQIIEDGMETDVIMIDINNDPPLSEGLIYFIHRKIKNIPAIEDRVTAIESLEIEL